jgi:hypothetical protein
MTFKEIISISIFLAITIFGCGHSNPSEVKNEPLTTLKYAGKFSFGKSGDGTTGSVIVYPETDSTILFWIDIYTGNLGQLYGRLKVNNGKGVFDYKEDDMEGCCKWQVTFTEDILTISTVDTCYACPFGGNVIADNKYKRIDKKKPDYFIDGHGHKIYFDKTTPETYQR